MILKTNTEVSKFLSYVLRHRPDKIGIELDKNGWIDINVLLTACSNNRNEISKEQLLEVVRNDNKERYALSEDGLKIRANQGHSVEVDLELKEQYPPEVLYHGTAIQNKESINSKGINKGNRHAVHMSEDLHTAKIVGERHGRALIYSINTKKMYRDGYKFFKSKNNVWLTELVPVKYLEIVYLSR